MRCIFYCMLGPSSQPIGQPFKLEYPSETSTIERQVHLLLQTIQSLSMAQQRSIAIDEEGVAIPHSPQNDGGATCALEASIIGACARLDTILEDPKRWTTNQNKRVENSLVRMHVEHVRMSEAQKKFVDNCDRPAYHLRPQLVHVDGQWLAVYGAAIEGRVVGLGTTPEKAMEDFDKQFRNEKPNPAVNLKDTLADLLGDQQSETEGTEDGQD